MDNLDSLDLNSIENELKSINLELGNDNNNDSDPTEHTSLLAINSSSSTENNNNVEGRMTTDVTISTSVTSVTSVTSESKKKATPSFYQLLCNTGKLVFELFQDNELRDV